MSGGSWDYIYFKIQEAADRLSHDETPLRRAFGQHMSLVAQAMHDIEWVDSNDKGKGADIKSMKKVLGDTAEAKELEISKEDARKLIKQLENLSKKDKE